MLKKEWGQYTIHILPYIMNQGVPIVGDLSQVYPDIEGELCSRHSILMGKLKNTYNKIYDHLDPSHYILLKGILNLYDDNNVSLSMALENGLILMSRPIDAQQSIYINSNHFNEELIFSCQGKLEEGLNENIDQITAAIRAATEGIKPEQLKGGIFYLHSNIAQNCFNYREILLLSIFLGVALINGTLQHLSQADIISKLAQYQFFGSRTFLEKLFRFTNRQFDLMVGQEHYDIPFERNNKLVLCQVDLARLDIKFEQSRKKQLLGVKDKLMARIRQQWTGLSSLLQVFQNSEEILPTLDLGENMASEDEPVSMGNYLEIVLKEIGLLSQFNSQNISFEQLVSAQWELNSQYWQVHTEEVIELVEEIKKTLNINSCMIINETYALIIADKNKYTELLVFLRQKLHKGELKSKSLFKIEEELVQHRWGSDKNIGEKMFTSVPSCGVSVFDPSEAIWFD